MKKIKIKYRMIRQGQRETETEHEFCFTGEDSWVYYLRQYPTHESSPRCFLAWAELIAEHEASQSVIFYEELEQKNDVVVEILSEDGNTVLATCSLSMRLEPKFEADLIKE